MSGGVRWINTNSRYSGKWTRGAKLRHVEGDLQVYTTSKWHFVRGHAFEPSTLVVEPFATQSITPYPLSSRVISIPHTTRVSFSSSQEESTLILCQHSDIYGVLYMYVTVSFPYLSHAPVAKGHLCLFSCPSPPLAAATLCSDFIPCMHDNFAKVPNTVSSQFQSR